MFPRKIEFHSPFKAEYEPAVTVTNPPYELTDWWVLQDDLKKETPCVRRLEAQGSLLEDNQINYLFCSQFITMVKALNYSPNTDFQLITLPLLLITEN